LPPLTPFSSVAHTFDRPGSVSVPEAAVIRYVRAAMDDLLAGGFRRLLLLTFNDYLAYYTPQEFDEDHGSRGGGHPPGRTAVVAGGGEDSLIVGALRVQEDGTGRTGDEGERAVAGRIATGAGAELANLLHYGVIGLPIRQAPIRCSQA
jgi:hypothetical protein